MRIHLDHVPAVDEDHQQVDYASIIAEAISLGYQSVMVDASRLSLEENIRATRTVADLARASGVAVEAELGAVLGHEAGPLPPYEELFRTGKGFTRPDEAKRFVRESGCDWLSVAIGNIHGAIGEATKNQKKPEARLSLDHLSKLANVTGVPLVLHGGTSIPDRLVPEAAKRGVAKINFGTRLKQLALRGLAESVPGAPDGAGVQRSIGSRSAEDVTARGMALVTAEVSRLIGVYGSRGRA